MTGCIAPMISASEAVGSKHTLSDIFYVNVKHNQNVNVPELTSGCVRLSYFLNNVCPHRIMLKNGGKNILFIRHLLKL